MSNSNDAYIQQQQAQQQAYNQQQQSEQQAQLEMRIKDNFLAQQNLNEYRGSEDSSKDSSKDSDDECRVQEYTSENVKCGDQGSEVGTRRSRNMKNSYRDRISSYSQEE